MEWGIHTHRTVYASVILWAASGLSNSFSDRSVF